MIGERIRVLRLGKGWSISELADKANVAKSYISSMERDIQKNPSIHMLEKVAEALEVPVDAILNDPERGPKERLNDEWLELVREAMASGVTKEQFREYLEFNRWKRTNNK
ncbi:helix-turn-helix domain-containing protein [Paenibacillus hemerocallicola]|jgi:XRE family transcriptional regulator of biofilm formation|uniref:Helix-turn-helix domain-containing protein n=1 Tax=Paenibacillus hemerocallicola TaxID=1172614 RepID=A0A5C4SW13_9BACL|nr:helix-turn-helix domain-containing protein [Paenibacillus hemerocallicola]TNJ55424.1 helix-turn-helix domain-containing protein [Paenibacillus hemerocallicola]